jgi:uridine kinase
MKDSNTIILIVGLPGSGKSKLANQINLDNHNKFRIINDPKNFNEIKKHIDENLIITDPYLCFEKNRQQAEKLIKKLNPNSKIEWIFFENNPKQCLINSNVRNRANTITFKPIKKVESFIKNFSQYYNPPENSLILKVWEN